MRKVITYGTFDLLHRGHIRLLRRARALGDYLVVGVTADDFDKSRGKINVSQPLMERVEAVRATGLADEIVIEEYEGQKIDDIRRLGIDVFTVGSDWVGKFDYLSEWCEVVYLSRTQGVSSTELRSKRDRLRLGIVGGSGIIEKYVREASFVDGLEPCALCTNNGMLARRLDALRLYERSDYASMLAEVDAVCVVSRPESHYADCKEALLAGKHVLCESPVALARAEFEELAALAKDRGLILMDSIKTAYATAYTRLLLLLKSGCVGDVVSVEATCTSLWSSPVEAERDTAWNSITAWGPTTLLPVFQLLGTDWRNMRIVSRMQEGVKDFDTFSKIDFVYSSAVASCKVGRGVKSEGELVISGTEGYVVVPAPWWKTDYFEVRREDPTKNRRYFYQLDGEGIRYELVNFLHAAEMDKDLSYVMPETSSAICQVMEEFYRGNVTTL